jgi:hypothetical protein
MNIGKLARLGKKVADKRGGVEGLKGDAEQLKDIAKSEGSVKDKAKRAAEALRDPGASGKAKPESVGGEAAAVEPRDQQQV